MPFHLGAVTLLMGSNVDLLFPVIGFAHLAFQNLVKKLLDSRHATAVGTSIFFYMSNGAARPSLFLSEIYKLTLTPCVKIQNEF